MSESGRRRRPLRPLSSELTEPARHFTEELRQIYWNRTELNQRELAVALHLTKSPVSRYLSGQEIIPAGAFAAFCRIAGLTPREQQRLGELREKAARSADRDAEPGGATESAELTESSELTESDPAGRGDGPAQPGVAAPVPGLMRRKASLPAVREHPRLLSAALALTAVVATAGIVMALDTSADDGRSPATPAPEPSGSTACRTTRVYRVIDDGDILDSKRKDIGDVHVDDVFGLDEAPSADPYRFRDYGHVVGSEVKGYVDQAKLKPLGRRCAGSLGPDGERTGGGNAPARAHPSSSPSR